MDPQLQEQLKLLESSMEFFQHKQKILDQEMELLNREESLARKQKDLEDYEKEVITFMYQIFKNNFVELFNIITRNIYVTQWGKEVINLFL